MNGADWDVVPYPSGTRGDLYVSLFKRRSFLDPLNILDK